MSRQRQSRLKRANAARRRSAHVSLAEEGGREFSPAYAPAAETSKASAPSPKIKVHVLEEPGKSPVTVLLILAAVALILASFVVPELFPDWSESRFFGLIRLAGICFMAWMFRDAQQKGR